MQSKAGAVQPGSVHARVTLLDNMHPGVPQRHTPRAHEQLSHPPEHLHSCPSFLTVLLYRMPMRVYFSIQGRWRG